MQKDLLHEIPPREKAGAATNARFRFQTNLAVLELCDLLSEGSGETALVIEHLDDLMIVELDGEELTTFIQVKAKSSGAWTMNALTKTDKQGEAPTSIIGKLYQNAHLLKEGTRGLIFISNAPFSVKLKGDEGASKDSTHILGSELSHVEVEKIDAALEPDFPSPREPGCTDLLSLRRTDLSHTDPDVYVIGRITKLLEEAGIQGAAATAIYKTVYHDLLGKASRVGVFSSTAELIRQKGVTRTEFSNLLEKAGQQNRFESVRDVVNEDLRDHGLNSIERARLLSSCHSFLAKRAQGGFAETKIAREAEGFLASAPEVGESATSIFELSEAIAEHLKADLELDDLLIRAGSLVVAAEHVNG